MNIADPPLRLSAVVGTIAFSDEGELAAVVVASDYATNIARLTLCDAFMQSFTTFDGFCRDLIETVSTLARSHELDVPAAVFADPSLLPQLERHERLLFADAFLAHNELVGTFPYPEYIEPDPCIRTRAVTAARVSGSLWIAPLMAAKMRRYPFDALALHRFGPGGAVLPDALSLALEVLRDPAPRRKTRARRNPHSASSGQSAAR
jgi:hypothetical protein